MIIINRKMQAIEQNTGENYDQRSQASINSDGPKG